MDTTAMGNRSLTIRQWSDFPILRPWAITINMKGYVMTNIKNEDIGDFSVTGSWTISAKVRPDQDSKEVKQVTLKYIFDQTPLTEILSSALKDKRINWQSGARKKFSSIIDKSMITVKFEGGRGPVDPKAQALAYFASLTPEEREALLNQAS